MTRPTFGAIDLDEEEILELEEEEQEDDEEEFEELEDRGDDFDEEDDSEDEGDEEEEDDESEEDDEEEDEDEDDEDEDDEDDEEEDNEPSQNQRIPRGRLNEVLKQRDEERERSRWLEERLEQVLSTISQPKESKKEEEELPTYDFETAEDTYIELLLEGEKSKAVALRKEIQAERDKQYHAEMKRIRTEAEEKVTQLSTSSKEEREFQSELQDIVSEYDFFNHKSDSYNADAVQMANKIMAGYLANGVSKIEALRKSVEDVAPYYDKPAPKPKAKSTRAKKARKVAADTTKRQPASTRSSSTKSTRDTSKLDISRMSDKAFNSLTAKEKRALRGD